MPKIDEATKQKRLDRIYLLLCRHSLGLTEAEIADEIGLERRTTNNYLRELETEGKAYKDGLYWIPFKLKESRLQPFDLSPEEAVTLYLGARLLVKQQDKRNEPAETALVKLAAVLKADAGIGDEIAQAARELAGRPMQESYQPIFRDVVRGYIYRKKIEISYRPLRSNKVFQTTFSTYLIEPSPIGFSTYLIGYSSNINALRAYKLERIEAARLTREEYAVPSDFPGLDILRNAWSIVLGDETLRVVLRFSPDVKKRVLETRWHPSQQTADDPERPGWLRWQVDVADTLDLLPWVRGWGADVEVLEPDELRKALKREARNLAGLYEVMEMKVGQMLYYGHSRKGEDKSEWQLLKDHLVNTADLAGRFGADAGISELARVAGLLHDIGKYSKAFQARLDGSGRKVDHATAGAREARELFKQDQAQQSLATMLAYCIAGHHTGLPDYGSSIDVDGSGTLLARIEKKELEDFSAYKTEIDATAFELKPRIVKTSIKNQGFSISFLTRMLYSALVDADFQDTEEYINGKKPRGEHASIETLCGTFNMHLQQYDNPESEINKKRTETLKACLEKAAEKQGFYTLTVPTGGGKTLASMAFALNHAVKHGLKRIIYVIPFTSIIEQNAAVFKESLGAENILEHHSNFDWKKKSVVDTETAEDEVKDALDKLKLASENWDIPVVVTTNVQFFESLFANKSSRCRKLHNVAKSVIIFDEAQMLPRDYLDPCMLAVKELVQNYGATTVFCTATQPVLGDRLPGIEFTELAPDPQGLFDFYKRVEIKNVGKLPDTELLERIATHPQALCIVNTRKHAKGLFDALPKDDGNFHLSTLMCPTHRKEQLLKIRELLKSGKFCRVISTQVMEAGIDVDFPVGYRALAGLDSIIQAAGRVNREGKNTSGDMFVFEPETPLIKKIPSFVKQGASVAVSVLRDYSADPVSVQAINAYFKMLDNLQDPKHAFDAKGILRCFNKGTGELDFDFKTAADEFSLIENNTVGVVIPYNPEAEKLLERARFHPFPYTFARQLQMYTVNIYEYEFEKLQSKGVIEPYNDTYQVLTNKKYYDERTGLFLPEEAGGDALFFDG